jgi:hypothetical protein
LVSRMGPAPWVRGGMTSVEHWLRYWNLPRSLSLLSLRVDSLSLAVSVSLSLCLSVSVPACVSASASASACLCLCLCLCLSLPLLLPLLLPLRLPLGVDCGVSVRIHGSTTPRPVIGLGGAAGRNWESRSLSLLSVSFYSPSLPLPPSPPPPPFLSRIRPQTRAPASPTRARILTPPWRPVARRDNVRVTP